MAALAVLALSACEVPSWNESAASLVAAPPAISEPLRAPAPRLDSEALAAIDAIPGWGDAELLSPAGTSLLGSAILTVSKESVRLVAAGRETSGPASFYLELPLAEGDAEQLRSGLSGAWLELPAPGYARISERDGTRTLPITRLGAAVNQLGQVSLLLESGQQRLRLRGRLTGACEQPGPGAIVRQLADLERDPRCARLIGWL